MGNIEKGYLGSLIVEKQFVKNGFNVFKPSMENGKVDMIIEKDYVYLKLQIKPFNYQRAIKLFQLEKFLIIWENTKFLNIHHLILTILSE